MSKRLLLIVVPIVALLLVPFALVAFGGGTQPPAMRSISDPFAGVDYSDLPELSFLEARDGTALAYRRYPGDGGRVVLALHGSSAESRSLHPLARSLSREGIEVFVPDIRGHGESGTRGDIGHIGQLEDDIADFLAHIAGARPDASISLLGFSSGGGLALRHAGSGDADMLDKLVMVSPMLGIDAPPTEDPNPNAREDQWAHPFIPRIIGLSILNNVGIHAFDHLPVIAFAVHPGNEHATARYSHRLLASMNPQDYEALLEATPCPVTLLAGSEDEVFASASYANAVQAVRPEADVRLIDGVDHVGMTLDPKALDAIAEAVPAKPDQDEPS